MQDFTFKEVEGYPVKADGWPSVKLFMYYHIPPPYRGPWIISEASTGMQVSSYVVGLTQRQVKAELKRFQERIPLDKMQARVAEVRNMLMKNNPIEYLLWQARIGIMKGGGHGRK